jgi:hypothetical protein
MQDQSDWFQLYRGAVLETEWYRVNDRIDAASRSIRAQLLRPTIDAGERQEMERCLRYLGMLRRVEHKLAS